MKKILLLTFFISILFSVISFAEEVEVMRCEPREKVYEMLEQFDNVQILAKFLNGEKEANREEKELIASIVASHEDFYDTIIDGGLYLKEDIEEFRNRSYSDEEYEIAKNALESEQKSEYKVYVFCINDPSERLVFPDDVYRTDNYIFFKKDE